MKHRDVLIELRGTTTEALITQLAEYESEILKLRFDFAFRKLKATHRIREIRKQIARIHTLLREKIAQAQTTESTEGD